MYATISYSLLLIVLPLLRNNYTRLCTCLPQDYRKSLDTLKQLLPGAVHMDSEYRLTQLPTIELINERLVAEILVSINGEDGVFDFCDIMENLCEETSISFITSLRNGMYCALLFSLL